MFSVNNSYIDINCTRPTKNIALLIIIGPLFNLNTEVTFKQAAETFSKSILRKNNVNLKPADTLQNYPYLH